MRSVGWHSLYVGAQVRVLFPQSAGRKEVDGVVDQIDDEAVIISGMWFHKNSNVWVRNVLLLDR